MASQPVPIQWPFAGVHRAAGYQATPPFSTPAAQNVRPRETFTSRRMGGSRPGLTKAYLTELGTYDGTAGTATNANPSVIDDAAVSDWRYYVEVNDTLEVVSGTNVTPGTYTVSAVDSAGATFTLSSNICSGGAGSAIVYTIHRATKEVNLLGSVRPITDSFAHMFTEEFLGENNAILGSTIDGWATTTWTGYNDDPKIGAITANPGELIHGAYVLNYSENGALSGSAVHDALPNHDTTTPYKLQMWCRRNNGTHFWAGKWIIFVCMDNSTPNPLANGMICICTRGNSPSQANLVTLQILRYESSVLQETVSRSFTASPSSNTAFSLIVTVRNSTKKVEFQYNNQVGASELASATFTGAVPGHRWGIGFDNNVASLTSQTNMITALEAHGIVPYFDLVQTAHMRLYGPIAEQLIVQYARTAISDERQRRLVACTAGNLWIENEQGELTQIANHSPNANLRVRDDVLLQGVERGGKFYIADYGARVTGTDGTTADATPDTFDSATYTDWTTTGVQVGDIITITSGTGIATAGVQVVVQSVSAGSLGISGTLGTLAVADKVFSIQRGPKVFDPDTGILSPLEATVGLVPTGCAAVELFNDRLVWGKDFYNPNVWYMSRQGTPTDYDYGAADSDPQKADAGSSSDAGVIADSLTGLASASDDYLIFFAENTLHVLRGNPAKGGAIDNLSRAIGGIFRAAWCHGPGGEIYFLSRDGMYVITPGIGGSGSPISRYVVPKDLIELNVNSTRIMLEFDLPRNGVHIFLAPESDGSSGVHWFFDLETKSFWPEIYPTTMQPRSTTNHYLPGSEDRIALMGGRDGFIRRFEDDIGSDDGTAIASYVLIGPIRLGPADSIEGVLTEINGIFLNSSNDVTWEIFAGDSAEEAYANAVENGSTPVASGTFSRGVSYRDHPRVRGAAVIIKVSNSTADRRWAMDRIEIMRAAGGRVRRA